MGFYGTIFELIDTRSFSNIWYWIVLAAVWSAVSYRALGVPHDLLLAASRSPEAQAEVEALARIHGRRLLRLVQGGGALLLGVISALLTMLAILGFAYRVELAQALLLLLGPLIPVAWLSAATAHRVLGEGFGGAPLRRRLALQRRTTQGIGMATIFVTAMWGMYQNLSFASFLR